jgi:hypothetical protein
MCESGIRKTEMGGGSGSEFQISFFTLKPQTIFNGYSGFTSKGFQKESAAYLSKRKTIQFSSCLGRLGSLACSHL